MPNDNLIQDAELFISKREGTFNTPVTDEEDYERAGWQNAAVYLPEPEFTNDAGRAGNASELQTGQCLTRFNGPSIAVADRPNFGLYGKVGMRCFGGTPLAPVELVTAVAWRHAANWAPKTAGKQLPSFNAITVSGGASTLWPGCVVNDFSLSQQGVADPQIAFSLLASGKHRIPHLLGVRQVETITVAVTTVGVGNAKITVTALCLGPSPVVVTFAVANSDTAAQVATKARTALSNHPIISDFWEISGASADVIATLRHTAPNDTTMSFVIANDTSTGVTTVTSANTTPGDNDLPDVAPFACLDTKPILEYTDDVGLRDLAADCNGRAWSVGMNNNHDPILARCWNDPKQAPGDYAVTTGPALGAYNNKSVYGVRSIAAEIAYLVKNRVTEWEKMCKSVQLTNVTFGVRGALLDEGTSTYESLRIIIPKAKFNGVRGDNIDGYASFRFSFAAEFDATAIGARIEVVNGLNGVSPVYN